jgi:hypothetical protein
LVAVVEAGKTRDGSASDDESVSDESDTEGHHHPHHALTHVSFWTALALELKKVNFFAQQQLKQTNDVYDVFPSASMRTCGTHVACMQEGRVSVQ